MTSKTHVALGIATSLVILHYYPNIDTYKLISGMGIGSLIPDLDTKKSDPSQIFPPVSWLVDRFTKHRGFTHTMLPLLFIIAYFCFNSIECLFIGLGGITHLIIDVLTLKVGIKCNSGGEKILYTVFWSMILILTSNMLCLKYRINELTIQILNQIYLNGG